jgi:hypothetical protein
MPIMTPFWEVVIATAVISPTKSIIALKTHNNEYILDFIS